jgi:hypothetical protein
MPPEISTNIAATAKIPRTIDALRISLTVVMERKLGSEIVAIQEKPRITRATRVSLRVKNPAGKKAIHEASL